MKLIIDLTDEQLKEISATLELSLMKKQAVLDLDKIWTKIAELEAKMKALEDIYSTRPYYILNSSTFIPNSGTNINIGPL